MEEKGCTTSQLDCELCFPQLHRATLRSPAEKPTHVPFTTPGGDRHAVMTSTQNALRTPLGGLQDAKVVRSGHGVAQNPTMAVY